MQTGSRLAHYELCERIGTGGMGEVWRASDLRLDRQVALKLLPEDFTDDAGRHRRFHREAQVLASLSHPNIAGIHSLEEEGERHFLVMELVEGGDLSDRIAAGALPVPEAVDVARQMAMALEAAHARGIIHRDLKPANVKLEPEGGVKVLDFGLAKVLAGGEAGDKLIVSQSTTESIDLTRVGVLLGTAGYMSPEQARGQVLDARTDIWSFGCVLYEMLTGRAAFVRDNLSDTLAATLQSDPDWSALPAATPGSVRRLLRRCLTRSRKDRLHNIADARIELQDAFGEESAPAAVAAPVSRAVRLLRWGWLLPVAGVAALALLGPRDRTADPVRLTNLTFSGRDWAATASPAGDVIAFASDRDGISRIWLKQLGGGAEVPLTVGPDDLPRISPDGSQVLFVRDEDGRRALYRTALFGGVPRKVVENVSEGDWSPDGQRVAFLRLTPGDGMNQAEIGIAQVQSGAERILARVDNRLCYGLRWSPDGSVIALSEGPLTGNASMENFIDLIDVETGRIDRISPTEWDGAFTAVSWSPDGRSFLVGQSDDALAHISGLPGQVYRYEPDSGRRRPLFWAPLRIPRGGWGFSTLAVLDDRRVVLDRYAQYAELREVGLPGEGQAAGLRIVTAGQGHDRQPVYSPDGTKLAFSSNRSGNIDLWLADLVSGAVTQLTDDPANDWDPAFTPDGEQILWSSDRGGHMEIWIAGLDGSGARQVSSDGQDAENPTMTPDGRWIVYASNNNEKRGIWRVRSDGSESLQLTHGSHLLPEVSPDGRFVLHSEIASMDYVIRVIELDTGRRQPFTVQIPISERSQDVVYGRSRWMPDGSAIVYIGQGDDGTSGVYSQRFIPGAPVGEPRVPVAGFSPQYSTESLGVAPGGDRLTISSVYNRRVLQLADRLDLGWRD